MKKSSIIVLAVVFLSYLGLAQEWLVPHDQKNLENPIEYNLENVKKGKDLYIQHCKSCHGDAGKNNHLPLVPPPPDVTSETMQANTQGELYYKITKGRGGMPQFETTLSDDERWRLVSYIMNYSPDNEPLLVEAPPKNAKILASVNETEKRVEVFAEFEDNGKFVELTETPVLIGAKKAFGTIPIGQVLTNAQGRAEYTIPETLIGDEEGLVNIVVELDEGFIVDPVVLDAAKVAQPKPTPQLIKKEVLWSTNENVNIWLLFSYIASVGGAWAAIGYVVFQLVKIKRASQSE
jgi:mono/diheme cytochrome c family protein